ncbi:MAG: DUF3299 domain-containing protein [Gemmatimonadaceae bacterium]|jgi:hypothetical protein|nr:DUF3299 domain-containing protein [Gemmatimonadaceae bacterium]
MPTAPSASRRLVLAGLVLAAAGAAMAAAPPPPPTARPVAMTLAAAMADTTAQIDWRILAGLDYNNNKATDTLKKLNGRSVRIPGFVVPLDDFAEEGAEFLLVPYYGACVHTPPPPPNQMVFVEMAGKKNVKLNLFDAVWMYGKLTINQTLSPYGAVGFKLEGLKVEPYSTR